ncbi:MAG TPA: PilZ domain-containing protein [Candidatus Sulfotelmatobacter sp.]|nr:PilZ domain-containing protein [Candidatus Sulfotelmatobacter sp.]
MTLSALLVCIEEAPAEVLRRVLEELSIRVEPCPDFARAAIRLAQERFDVVIVDGDSNREVISLLRETRLSRLNDATLAVAVVAVAGQEHTRELFSLGVNFVLYKPVAYDRVVSSLRAARAAMRKEKRKNARAAVHTHATIDYANVQQDRATLIDLAQAGMQVQFGKKLPPTSKVYFQFKLPGQTASVRLSGQMMWQDWNGRAGVQFVDVPTASRKLLTDFLGANLPSEALQAQFPDVTVEVEEPRQLATLSVAEQTHGSRRNRNPVLADAQESGSAGPDPDHRRQIRYACRLGAEVYRAGVGVPHHCFLTDLSFGGCYVEVPARFPKAAAVEIVIRTYDMKLLVRGTVQASDPGYGIGVAFELTSREERDNVKKLIDYVASTTEPSN